MIDLMGGSIVFQSVAASGTSVKIEVPLSIDTEGADTSDDTDSNEVRLHLIGFKNRDGLGLAHMAASMKRQFKASNCSVVRNLAEADAVLIEEHCDITAQEQELLAFTRADHKQIIMFGAATSPQRPGPPTSMRICDEDVPVTWVFRPLLPPVIDRILSAARARSWDNATAAQNTQGKRNQMINPDTATTESDSDADPNPSKELSAVQLPEPAMSDPILPSLKNIRPQLVERSETTRSASMAPTKDNGNDSSGTELQAAFKGIFLSHHSLPDSDQTDHLAHNLSLGRRGQRSESTIACRRTEGERSASPCAHREMASLSLRMVSQKMGIHVAEAVDGEDGISEYTIFKPGLGTLSPLLLSASRKIPLIMRADIFSPQCCSISTCRERTGSRLPWRFEPMSRN